MLIDGFTVLARRGPIVLTENRDATTTFPPYCVWEMVADHLRAPEHHHDAPQAHAAFERRVPSASPV